jgi:hypothetical protein
MFILPAAGLDILLPSDLHYLAYLLFKSEMPTWARSSREPEGCSAIVASIEVRPTIGPGRLQNIAIHEFAPASICGPNVSAGPARLVRLFVVRPESPPCGGDRARPRPPAPCGVVTLCQ